MSNAMVSGSNFVLPSIRTELNGELGLDLHQIAKSLNIEFKDAKKKLLDRGMLERIKTQHFTAVAIATSIESLNFLRPTQEVESYVLDINAAKFFVAKYDNEIGDAYLACLIGQENTMENILANPRRAAALLLQKADADDAVRALTLINAHQNQSLTTSQSRNAPLTQKNNVLQLENRTLKDQVGDSTMWKKAIAARSMFPAAFKGLSDIALGKFLTKVSKSLGRIVKKIENMNYGYINSYHIEAVKEAAKQRLQILEA